VTEQVTAIVFPICVHFMQSVETTHTMFSVNVFIQSHLSSYRWRVSWTDSADQIYIDGQLTFRGLYILVIEHCAISQRKSKEQIFFVSVQYLWFHGPFLLYTSQRNIQAHVLLG
jgi:hypothetical protein